MKKEELDVKSIKDGVIEYMNPYHIQYIKEYPYNSIYHLFKLIENLDEEKKCDTLSHALAFYGVNLKEDKDVQIQQLKRKCIDIANISTELVSVNAFVSVCANGLLTIGNPININKKIEEAKIKLERMKCNQQQILGKVKENNPEVTELDANSVIEMFSSSIINMKENQEKSLELYNYFCNNIVKGLIEEDYNETKQKLGVYD